MANLPKAGKTTTYEVWAGGTDFRYSQAANEADAKTIADELAEAGHPTVEIHQITTTRKVVE